MLQTFANRVTDHCDIHSREIYSTCFKRKKKLLRKASADFCSQSGTHVRFMEPQRSAPQPSSKGNGHAHISPLRKNEVWLQASENIPRLKDAKRYLKKIHHILKVKIAAQLACVNSIKRNFFVPCNFFLKRIPGSNIKYFNSTNCCQLVPPWRRLTVTRPAPPGPGYPLQLPNDRYVGKRVTAGPSAGENYSHNMVWLCVKFGAERRPPRGLPPSMSPHNSQRGA